MRPLQDTEVNIQRVEVLPHSREPVGSYAVIKLLGISQLNGPAAFQLEPAAPGERTPPDWPVGDLSPIGVRTGNGTVELLIGPEITKVAALKSGVAVRFLMPSAQADATIIWPDLMTATPRPPALTSATMAPRDEDASVVQRPVAAVDANPGLGNSAAPAERGLSRLQRRGTAVAGPTGVTSTAAASPIPLPSLPDLRPTATPPVVSPQAGGAATGTVSFVPVALGAVIVLAMLVMFLRTTTFEGTGVTLYSALMARNGSQGDTEISAKPRKLLSEILQVRAVSPSGQDATGVSQRQALERASRLAAEAKTPEARAEAAFWLRRALSKELSEPRLVWAVTQLGTAYATRDAENQPNYEAARLLWNWAADAGDAQAACFLGHLFERGLGVAASGQKARTFYERARQLGSCPGLQQALARVRNIP